MKRSRVIGVLSGGVEPSTHKFEVGHEAGELFRPGGLVGSAQDGRWVHGGQCLSPLEGYELAPLLHNAVGAVVSGPEGRGSNRLMAGVLPVAGAEQPGRLRLRRTPPGAATKPH